MSPVSMFGILKAQLPLLVLGLLWAAYLIWGARWLRGVKRARLF